MKTLIRIFLSLLVGFFFLNWIRNSADLTEISIHFDKQKLNLLLGCILFYAIAIVCRIFRWKTLLSSHTQLSFSQTSSALITGYAMNFLLPARMGELFRANICKKWYNIPRSTALASILLERLADGIIVMFALITGAISLNTLNQHPEIFKLVIVGTALFTIITICIFLLKTDKFIKLLNFSTFLKTRVNTFREYIENQTPHGLFYATILSLIIWIFEGMCLWLMVKIAGVQIGVMETFLLVGVVSLSTLLPSPPGFLGTMQFAYALTLKITGHPMMAGVVAATINQVFLMGSVIFIGLGILGVMWLKKKLMKSEERATPNNLQS